mgnify:CR=1 FL=1
MDTHLINEFQGDILNQRILGRSLVGVQRRYADASPNGVSLVGGIGLRKT